MTRHLSCSWCVHVTIAAPFFISAVTATADSATAAGDAPGPRAAAPPRQAPLSAEPRRPSPSSRPFACLPPPPREGTLGPEIFRGGSIFPSHRFCPTIPTWESEHGYSVTRHGHLSLTAAPAAPASGSLLYPLRPPWGGPFLALLDSPPARMRTNSYESTHRHHEYR